ncbi:MAG: M67 family metallopeptidase [Nitrososphaeraceae archaeon]
MIITISISQQHLLELERIAKECYPAEACALLEGTFMIINDKSDDEQANVLAVLRMRNADDSIYSFRIDSNELINAYQEISSRNMEVVGIFHSHSSKAYPSIIDKEYMELNPVVWLIYSTLSHSFAAYVLDDKVVQIKLETSSVQYSP